MANDTPPTSAAPLPNSLEGRLAVLFERFNDHLRGAAGVGLEIAEVLGEASEKAILDADEAQHMGQDARAAKLHHDRAGAIQRRAGVMLVLSSFLRGDHDADLVALLKGEPL